MPSIEYVTVANHAEAHNGLLYLQGAGWTDITLGPSTPGQPAVIHFGIGVSVMVDWNETNQNFPLTIEVVEADRPDTPLIQVQGQMEAGRPPGALLGAPLRSVIALNAEAVLERPGVYEVTAQVGSAEKRVAFRAQQAVG